MKHLILALTLSLLPSLASFPPEYATLLEKYVNSSGVDYEGLYHNNEDQQKLHIAVDYYAKGAIPEDPKEALSWHLNAYNAWIIKKIIDKYPTKGPISGGDLLFFRKKSIKIAGKKTSFDKLEQKVIRPVYQESRIHFALNCASTSCPPLRNEPYIASKLNAQLNEQAEKFINQNTQGLQVSKTGVHLSKIFEWYADDFGGKDNLMTWINHYKSPQLPLDSNVQFLKYDWTLNSQ